MNFSKYFFLISFLFIGIATEAQNYLKNWYFGTGTDGIRFVNNIPQKLTDKVSGIGFEGMIVVNDPATGDMLFYSDGQQVINKNHVVMTNGSGMTGHFSGAQCVQSCPVPGTCAKKFYLFTNSAWDNTAGAISYSIIDFTTDPLGVVTNKNTVFWTGPSDQAMCLVSKPGTRDYWLIANDFTTAKYNVWSLTTSGIGAPVSYTFSSLGSAYQMNFDKVAGKLTVTGYGNKRVTLINFNPTTGVLSNETQIGTQFGFTAGSRFSPDGSKLYASAGTNAASATKLYQYDLATTTWTDMNTCCYAHDLKMGPDGKMYFINSYSSTQPISAIDFPNMSAVGNACNYHVLTFTPPFNGEVRRFPETIILPDPPIANTDIVTLTGTSISIPVLNNDVNPQGGSLTINAIVKAPTKGTAVISGTDIIYTANQPDCDISDTLIYSATDNDCGIDTAMVIVNYPVCTAVSCNSWLNTPSPGSFVSIGNLGISGNKLTIEAEFNSTTSSAATAYSAALVSKHTNPADCNFVLRTDAAQLSTASNGLVTILSPCTFETNKTYHVAMVYDGTTLKFYQNGFLVVSAPQSGNLVTNSLNTRIGAKANGIGFENLLGNINEVRIWNVARTQAEIRSYMNVPLPNPTTQTGLLGYYTFNNLLNKQGNAAFNGTLNGSATINATNPQCTFSVDSCPVAAPPVIINDYTPVISLDPCTNLLTVENATKYNVGDTVMIIQMKGAVIDQSNTAAFGTITNYKNAGNYEFNYVKSKTGNVIELKNTLLRQYDLPDGKVQLVRVPYYDNYTTASTLTCLPWDGSKGGVLVLNVQNTVTLNADIDVSGNGFKGGVGYNPGNGTLNCFQNNYNYAANTINAAQKGESITTLPTAIICGKGNPAGGGGGGLGHNSGGGGGGNAGAGGFGGYQLDACGSAPFDNRGIGGRQLAYSTAANKIFMGSGGGAGHADNPGNTPPAGGDGGGIAIIIADKIQSNSKKIISNGNTAIGCTVGTSPDCHDGMGGGGSGGTVLLSVNQILDNSTIEDKGGNGADVTGAIAGGKIGPGGGGGGGLAFLKSASTPGNLTINNNGGINGVMTTGGNDAWGATAGSAGTDIFNLSIPISTVPFKKNIDSVRFTNTPTSCTAFNFFGLAYFNTANIQFWNWTFGDGGVAITQNPSHNYTTAGTYTVKLVVTDINGCKDSISNTLNTNSNIADAGKDTSICTNTAVSVVLHGNPGATTYNWKPAALLNDPSLQEPIATVSSTTRFYLTATNALGCGAIDSVDVIIHPIPSVQTLKDTATCKGSLLVLTTTPGIGTYSWTHAIYVSDPTISNPIFIGTTDQTLHVSATDANGCFASDDIAITVKPLPTVKTIEDTTICSTKTVTLTTTGAVTYTWDPPTGLSSTISPNPVFSGTVGGPYHVTGISANGCAGKDTVNITVNIPGNFKTPPNKIMCDRATVQLDGANGIVYEYLWSPGTYLSSSVIINPIANPPYTTTYTVRINDKVCDYAQTYPVKVTVNPLPFLDAIKLNDIDCANRSAKLYAGGFSYNYTWSPAYGLNNTNIRNPVATPAHTQTYYLLATDSIGCVSKDSVTVEVNTAASLARFMPNSFTPNNDGKNDCFGMKNWMYIKELKFRIYDRWGEQVFFTSNPGNCWDGRFKNKDALAGNYVYSIQAKTECGDVNFSGNVILIRQ